MRWQGSVRTGLHWRTEEPPRQALMLKPDTSGVCWWTKLARRSGIAVSAVRIDLVYCA